MPDMKTIALYLAITGILNLLIGHKSQIDTWAESKPRLAAALKLVRGLGLDPWLLIQSLSLAVNKQLPEKLKAPRVPPLALLALPLLLLSCSSSPPKPDDALRALRATCAVLAEDDAINRPSWGGQPGAGGMAPVSTGEGGGA